MKTKVPGEATRSRVVLLIDDDEDDFELFNHALEELAPDHVGVLLTKVENIIGYFESLPDSEIPCLVVTDLNIPPSDGFEVIEKLKADPRYAHIPIIVYSNSANPRDVQRARQLGATTYVHKATSIQEVQDDVKAMLHYCLAT